MAKVIGRTGAIGIGLESTRGTAVAPAYWVPVQSYSVDDNVEYVKNDSALGVIAEHNAADITKRWSEGDYSGKIFLDSVGEELAAVLGATPSSSQRASSGVYDHTYIMTNNNQHKSLTVAYKDGVQDVRMPFCMVNTWSLDIVVDDYVKRTISLMGKKSADASNTAAFTDENEFIPKDGVFKVASSQAGLAGASAVNITAFSMEIAKNPEAVYALGSNEPEDIINKQFAVTGSVELYFEDETFRDYALDGTKRAMRIQLLDTDTDLGSSHNPELYFDFYNVVFDEFSRSWDANDPLKQTLNFEALYSITDSTLLTCRLTNTESGY